MKETDNTTNEGKDLILSPSEFYKKLRPENFSDSKNLAPNLIPREVLAFELEKITTNQKENQFETLARRMAEKLVAPNLIPQVGPTGGGDGKTDSETYPVATSISDRWFIPNNGWEKDEKWAIAISAKVAWKSKMKSDIVSILSTERDYTKIFFITNQTPSSKKKKDAQDEYIKEFKIDIVILDGLWILENTYSNNLTNLVIVSLNLSSIYRQEEKSLGPNDIRRENQLVEIEENISNSNRYFENDFQLVEDALESAILTRKLEKSRTELEGKFDRVERLLNKVDNLGQRIRFRYQKAWTYVNYYDDYKSFLSEFLEFKKLFPLFITISSIEFYATLFTLLRNTNLCDKVSVSDQLFLNEKKEFYSLFEEIGSKTPLSSVSLTAKMHLNIIKSFKSNDEKTDINDLFINMKEVLIEAENRLEFPFEQFQRMIGVLGEVFIDSLEFDELYEIVTKISESRNSQMQAGQLYINRGGQKMANERYRDALVYFGKAITKLSKNESQQGFYLASIGLSEAYNQLGLFNASYSSKIAGISILLKPWFDEGYLDDRLLKVLDNLLGEEILLGRFPHILIWHELYKVIHYQCINQNKIEGFDTLTKFDAFVSIRLLNGKIKTKTLEFLPQILAKEGFLLSEDTSLFLLGYSEKIIDNFKGIGVKSINELESYYQKVSNQPLKQQFRRPLNFFNDESSILSSNILGCKINFNFKTSSSLIISAETILAYIEAFFGTSLENIFPNSETIEIELIYFKNEFRVENSEKSNHYRMFWDTSFDLDRNYESATNCCMDLVARILSKNYLVDNVKDYLTDLFKNQEVNERLSAVLNHKTFLANVIGESPKLTFKDWLKEESEKTLSIRKKPFFPETNIKVPKKKSKIEELIKIPHNKRKVLSIIDNELWDGAAWKGIGVVADRDSVGMVIGFENIEYGEKIFQDWIERYGVKDLNNKIKVSIITDIDNKNPFWYKVLFSSNFEGMKMDESSIFVTSCRFHLMNSTNNRNLLVLKEGIKRFKKFKLYPGKVEKDLSMKISFKFYLEKQNITFVRKDEIKENDIENTVLINDRD